MPMMCVSGKPVTEVQDCSCNNCRNACRCGSGEFKEAQYDAQNIFLCYTCEKCHAEQMRRYRPEILTGYNQSDVDEPIEPD